MKIVIVGAGGVGSQLAAQLIADNKDVVIIEKNPDVAKHASTHLDCIVITGEGNNPKILRKAGIEKADFFLSVTDSDEVNMISCALVASEFKVPNKIARVRNLDYSSIRNFEKVFLGIDFFVNPELEAAREIVASVMYGASSDLMLFSNANVQMRNVVISSTSFFKDKSLRQIKESLKKDFLISCIVRQDKVIIPSGNTIIRENDNIYLVATRNILEDVLSEFGRSSLIIKNIVIVGGGRIGRYTARYLMEQHRNIKIIDSDYENCKILADEFPKATIIHSDISDRDIFEEEQLYSYDLIVTTTNKQELNILAAIYAKTFGIKRSIAIVTRRNYLSIASSLGIDSIVSPKRSTVDAVLKFIRKGNIKSIYSILTGKAEVIEFSVNKNSPITGKTIENIRLPDNTLILAVTRGFESYIPGGKFLIQEGDDIITITTKESVSELEEIFNR
ncbi:MAG: Trk system potassium transporter TrkA [Proteobacteria bacterium]|nr:Trk system potassium transporter TrkA [Pseudomonadota bacterium]